MHCYGYQRALMLLYMQPWRLAFCPACGTRYVKTKPQQRFCTDKCFYEKRKADKRALWAEHGSEWRPKKTQRQRKSK
jgi:hypothetical protein